MEKTIKVYGKEVTASDIIYATYKITDSGMTRFSDLNGAIVDYQYRTQYPDGFYNDHYQPVCTPNEADYIRVNIDGYFVGDVSL